MDYYEFGPFRLEVSSRALYRGGEFVPVTPKALDTLYVLVEEAGHVVSKEDLLQRVWPGAFVEEGSIANNISTLRKVLNPHFEGDGPIATIARRGYRFTVPVTLKSRTAQIAVVADSGPLDDDARLAAKNVGANFSSPGSPAITRTLTAVAVIAIVGAILYSVTRNPVPDMSAAPVRRSVAVLPMKNLSDDAAHNWLSTALSETISAELAGGREFRVVSGENVTRLRQEMQPPLGVGLTRQQLNDIGSGLACDLILSGNYLVVGGKLRVDVRLDEVATGEAIASASITDSEDRFLDVVTNAGSKLRDTLGLSQPGRVDADAFRAAFSVSPDALRDYLAGLDALRLRDGPRARDLLIAATTAAPDFALAHAQLSTTWRLLGYDKRGAESAKRAFELSAPLTPEDRTSIEAQYHEATASFPRAIELYRQLWRQYPDNIEYGLKLANAQWLGGKSADALLTVDEMRKMPERDSRDVRIDLIDATAADVVGDMPRAIAVSARAADKALASKVNVMLARARIKQGIYAFRTGKFDEALAFFREAETLFAGVGEVGGEADALRWQGQIYNERVRIEDALAVLQRADALVAPLNYVRLTSAVHGALSVSYRMKGDVDRAVQFGESAVTDARESGDRTLESTALTNLGAAVRLTGDYARARDTYTQAAELSSAIGDVRARNAALNNSGGIDFLLGDLAAARQKFETALEIDRKLGNPAGTALRLQNLSRVVALQNELAEAEKMNAEECAIHETLKAKTALAWCRTRLADIYFERGRKDDAAALAKQVAVADLGSSATAPAYIARYARVQLHLGHLNAAAAAIEAAETVLAKTGTVAEQAIQVSVVRAEVEAAQGKRAAALTRLHRARADADQRGLVTWSLDAQRVLARIDSRAATVLPPR